ncbi:MAG: FAD-binding oxidoreductase [Thermodesulfovibrionia bacterium]|nr:FAD-binding oxidoreductase [Thermodesulfovibrionia bacterium]
MVIKKDKQEFFSYLEDTSNIKGQADILYLPETQQEVAEILVLCQRKRIPVTCSGARTGTTGGCVPQEGAVLSLEKLNKIKNIDEKSRIVTVESGANLKDLETELNKRGMSLKAQPTESLACIGGVVSTSASGVRGFKYGGIRNYVKRLQVVLVDGTTFELNRGLYTASGRMFDIEAGARRFKFAVPSYDMPRTKHQAGYFAQNNMDMIDLFIGSEGTLGVIVEVDLMVQSTSREAFDCVVFFDKQDDALGFVAAIKSIRDGKQTPPVMPSAMPPAGSLARPPARPAASVEFFDRNALHFLKQAYPQLKSSAAAVYFEQELQGDFDYQIQRWVERIRQFGGSEDDTWFGDTEAEREKIYEFRYQLPQLINEFLRTHNQNKVATDIAVPDNTFLEMFNFYGKVGEESGVFYVNFGHIGENHLHFNFLPHSNSEYLKAREYALMLVRKAVSLGGTVSAEHVIGKIKKEYLEILYGKKHIQEMASLKEYFDPSFLLGRGNIFDKNIL